MSMVAIQFKAIIKKYRISVLYYNCNYTMLKFEIFGNVEYKYCIFLLINAYVI